MIGDSRCTGEQVNITKDNTCSEGTSTSTEGRGFTMLGVLDNVNGRGSWSDFVVMLSQSDSKPPPHPLNVPREYMYGRMDMRSEGMWKRDS